MDEEVKERLQLTLHDLHQIGYSAGLLANVIAPRTEGDVQELLGREVSRIQARAAEMERRVLDWLYPDRETYSARQVLGRARKGGG